MTLPVDSQGGGLDSAQHDVKKPRAAPDFDSIETEDLRDDDRLKELYVQAVRRGYWRNTPPAALEFAAYAEKALQDDDRGTPEKLFYSLIKRKDGSKVTQTAENRAIARFPSFVREEMVQAAAEALTKRAEPLKGQGDIEDALIDRHLGYAHAVMMQCFLPQRPITNREYETSHGRASLLIEAGRLANPNRPRQWIKCAVPSGPKPRLILPYIVGQSVRNATPEIDLGRSLRNFMAKLGVPISGNNGKALTEQIQNLAAASVVIGEWTDDAVHTRGGRIAKRVSFWLERDPSQLSFWSPAMTLSDDFFQAIQQHRVPIDMAHLVRFARSPRRMDVYVWLSYRTPRIQPRVRHPISLPALWIIFAPEITNFRHFKNRLKGDLKAIHDVYPHFKVEIEGDILWLQRSPPPIPFSARVMLPGQPAS